MNIHYSRTSDLIVPDHLVTVPAVPTFRLGRFVCWDTPYLGTPASPMRFTRSAIRHAVQALPAETLVSLLGSRYCETDRLSEIAWNPVC